MELEETKSDSTIEEAPAEAKKADKPIMVPKNRLDDEIAKRKAAEQRIASWEAEQEKQAAEQLAEQGKFKDLYQKALADAKRLEDELSGLQFDSMRKQVAADAGFPQLWNRLQGSNEDELKADMAALSEVIPAPNAPNIDASVGSGKEPVSKDDRGKLTTSQKAEIAGVLGVEIKDIPDIVTDFQ